MSYVNEFYSNKHNLKFFSFSYAEHLEKKIIIQEKALRSLLEKYKESIDIHKKLKKKTKNHKNNKNLPNEEHILSPEIRKVNINELILIIIKNNKDPREK